MASQAAHGIRHATLEQCHPVDMSIKEQYTKRWRVHPQLTLDTAVVLE
jgi:hypothetical protein